jgi:hypothetical protein
MLYSSANFCAHSRLKWLAHLPFTSSRRFKSQWELLNVTRTQSSCEKSKKSTLCRTGSWVFSGYSVFPPTGKVDRVGWAHKVWRQIINEVWTNTAAAQAPFVSSKSTSVCFTSVRFYLCIHNVTSHWKALIGSVLWNICNVTMIWFWRTSKSRIYFDYDIRAECKNKLGLNHGKYLQGSFGFPLYLIKAKKMLRSVFDKFWY